MIPFTIMRSFRSSPVDLSSVLGPSLKYTDIHMATGVPTFAYIQGTRDTLLGYFYCRLFETSLPT